MPSKHTTIDLRFSGPKRVQRTLNTLDGMIAGLSEGDGCIRNLAPLVTWVGLQTDLISRHPLNEFAAMLHEAALDGVLDSEEIADMRWLIARLQSGGAAYNAITTDMQGLQGLLAGVIADDRVTMAELDLIDEWARDREHLRSTWPYEEIRAVLAAVKSDGVVDETEQKMLVEFFSEFVYRDSSKSISNGSGYDTIGGVCALNPHIRFPGNVFCFTGKSHRARRSDIAEVVQERGGHFKNNVSKGLNYLVVGADGSPAWTYACYGRKIEKAMNLRASGAPILVVHESDFWTANAP